MSSNFRRYELLLPLRFNDDQPIPDELIAQTLIDLRTQFGAVSAETQIIRGQWQNAGVTYRDDLSRIFIDVPDTLEARTFFLAFKEHLKARFQQLDIWVTSYPVEVI